MPPFNLLKKKNPKIFLGNPNHPLFFFPSFLGKKKNTPFDLPGGQKRQFYIFLPLKLLFGDPKRGPILKPLKKKKSALCDGFKIPRASFPFQIKAFIFKKAIKRGFFWKKGGRGKKSIFKPRGFGEFCFWFVLKGGFKGFFSFFLLQGGGGGGAPYFWIFRGGGPKLFPFFAPF